MVFKVVSFFEIFYSEFYMPFLIPLVSFMSPLISSFMTSTNKHTTIMLFVYFFPGTMEIDQIYTLEPLPLNHVSGYTF
jgi:hypothetical protein